MSYLGKSGSERLILLIRGAYWAALLIIAGMALASYLLLQQMMAAQQDDEELMTLASAQRTLSQRVVFLATAADVAPFKEKPPLLSALREATAEFEANYDTLLQRTKAAPAGPGLADPSSVENVLFGSPYHLDYFSLALATNGRRFLAAMETELGRYRSSDGYLADRPRARLDDVTAQATLRGYAALGERIHVKSHARLDRMLATHQTLFFATLAVILLVAWFIFRPIANTIQRRTRELVEARNAMAHQAVHDGLTGLYNRTFLTDHVDPMLRGTRRRRESLAVLQIDLDRFKQINDTFGHAAGDHVLVVTGQRMKDACRSADLCIRLGGDEFVVILSGAGDSSSIACAVQRVLDRINAPISFKGFTIHPGASAGVAVFPFDGETAEDLLVHADLALYSAKKQGGGAFSFFSDELRQELECRRQLERDLKAAIAAGVFEPHFQPQVSLTTGAITGVEALARWNHAERGMIAPGEFIPVAEKAGLMVQVGRIVTRKAIAAAAEWHRRDLPFGRLAINVSGSELRSNDFDAFLFSVLEESGLPPSRLSLEIVESVILDDEKTGIATKLRRIRAAGVNLELDDFGTGYASLSHVNPNEIDRLKIDRRFVQNINTNGDNSKIVRAITELARGLGIAIIAEGAETEAELMSLRLLGCEEVQGYSIARPMPADAAGEWLAARSSAPLRIARPEPRRA